MPQQDESFPALLKVEQQVFAPAPDFLNGGARYCGAAARADRTCAGPARRGGAAARGTQAAAAARLADGC